MKKLVLILLLLCIGVLFLAGTKTTTAESFYFVHQFAGYLRKTIYDVLVNDYVDGNDTTYDASWNGNPDAPTMNAVYDKINILGTGDMLKSVYDVLEDGYVDGNDTAFAASWNGNINAPSMNVVYDEFASLSGDYLAIDGSNANTDVNIGSENFTTTGTITAETFTDGVAILDDGVLTSVKLGTLTANGFVKTNSGDGTLSVDTNTYIETPVVTAPVAIYFGTEGTPVNQQYDITGTTWVTSSDGTPNQTAHLTADCLAAMATAHDGAYFNIREGSGNASETEPLTVQFNWTGISTFSILKTRCKYVGSVSHYLSVEIYDGASWEVLAIIPDEEIFTIHTFEVLNPADYIVAGAVKVRFRHIQNGISSHQYEVDYIVLSTGAGTGGGGVQVAVQTPIMDEFDFSANTNVQDVMDDIDAALALLDTDQDGDVDSFDATNLETAVEAVVDHDDLQNITANEHLDWTADQGATDIHAGNYSETDPCHVLHLSGYDHNDIADGATAYGWGDHGGEGYLTSYSETDPCHVLHLSDYDHNDIADGATAYGWGDHGGEGYITATLTQEEVEDYIGDLIEDGNSVQTRITVTYDDANNALGFVVDDLNTDDQTIDVFSISGNNVQLSLEDDGESTKTVDISSTTDVTANTNKVTESTTVNAPLSLSTYDMSIAKAATDANGYLCQTDWDTFNEKQDQEGVLDDLGDLGVNTVTSVFIVATGIGVLAWRTTSQVATLLGVGTTDSPTFAGLVLTKVGSLPSPAVVGKIVLLTTDGELYLGKND